MRVSIRLAVLLAGFAALAILSGCGPKEDKTSGAANSTSSPTTVANPAPTEAAKSDMSVVVISPALTSVFHQELVKGAEEEAAKLGWQYSHLEPDKETNSVDQVAKVQDSIQKGVKAISICAVNDEALTQAVKKANDAKIPIFVHNSITPVPGGDVVAYVGYDEKEGGTKC